MSFGERQSFLRLVVDGIVLEDGCVMVETVIPPGHDGTLNNIRGDPDVIGANHPSAEAPFDKSDFVATRDLRSELRANG